MKNSTVLFITSLLMVPLFGAETNEPNLELQNQLILYDKDLRKERQARITEKLHGGAQDCALMAFIEKRIQKLSPTEQDIKNRLGLMYHEAMLMSADSMTVSEYLEVLRSKNDQNMTVKEIGDGNTQTSWFSFGDGDVCYRMARQAEHQEKVLADFEARGHGDEIIRHLPELQKKLVCVKSRNDSCSNHD
jgi:hypothetical protein